MLHNRMLARCREWVLFGDNILDRLAHIVLGGTQGAIVVNNGLEIVGTPRDCCQHPLFAIPCL